MTQNITLGKSKILKKTFVATIFLSIVVIVVYALPAIDFSQLRKVHGYEALDKGLSIFGFSVPIIILIIFVIGFFYYKRKYSTFFYTIDEDSLNIKDTAIPYNKIQDVTVYQDFLDQFFGLNNVFIRSSSKIIHLDGISSQTATILLEKVLHKKVVLKNENLIHPRWLSKVAISYLLIIPFFMIFALTGLDKYLTPSGYGYYIREGHDIDRRFEILPIGLIILFGILAAIIQRKSLHYSLGDNFFIIKQGVLFKEQRYISYRAIKDTTVKRGVLDSIFGISSLVLSCDIRDYIAEEELKASGHVVPQRETAQDIGVKSNRVVIPGLLLKNAELLKVNIEKMLKT